MAVDGCGRTGVGELVDDVWVVLNEALDLDDPVVAEIVVLRGGGRAEEVGPRRQVGGKAGEMRRRRRQGRSAWALTSGASFGGQARISDPLN